MEKQVCNGLNTEVQQFQFESDKRCALVVTKNLEHVTTCLLPGT